MTTSTPLRYLLLAAILGTFAFAMWPSEANADIYRYRRKDGSVLITTQPQRGLKLIDRISDDSGSSASTSTKKPEGAHKPLPAATGGQREKRYDAIIRAASDKYEIPFAFIKCFIRVESNFNPNATSPVGAIGLMQLMPRTASALGVSNAYDPQENIFGGAKLLRMLTQKYNGDINLLLAAYNAGEGRVAQYNGIPYEKTREYVRKVYHYYKLYQQQDRASSSPP